MLDDIYLLITLKICGTDSLNYIFITATEYSYPRPTIPNNEESQETESESDDTASNNDYGSAFHAGSGGEISEKEDFREDLIVREDCCLNLI